MLKETKKSRYKPRRKLLSTQYHTSTCTLPQLHAVSSSTIQVQLHQPLVTSDWDKREPSTPSSLTFCSAPIQFAESTLTFFFLLLLIWQISQSLLAIPLAPRPSQLLDGNRNRISNYLLLKYLLTPASVRYPLLRRRSCGGFQRPKTKNDARPSHHDSPIKRASFTQNKRRPAILPLLQFFLTTLLPLLEPAIRLNQPGARHGSTLRNDPRWHFTTNLCPESQQTKV